MFVAQSTVSTLGRKLKTSRDVKDEIALS